jgi:thiosulfate dehydrogenase [quinone] large subunit
MVKAKKSVTYSHAWSVLAVARIMLGFVFLWAFLDKTMGLGFATQHGKAWLDGVSPTTGFLKFGVNADGPFVDFFRSLAGNVLVDWLFMLGLLGIGMALILGIGLRVAAVAGTTLLVMMWAAELPLKNNPVVDEHLVYAAVLWVVALAPRKYSLIETWLQTPTVKKNPWLW